MHDACVITGQIALGVAIQCIQWRHETRTTAYGTDNDGREERHQNGTTPPKRMKRLHQVKQAVFFLNEIRLK